MTTTQKHIFILLALSLLFFLGNQAIAVTDPVEANYTETAWEMLQSGDLFSPRIYGNYWYDKPVFFYWELITAFATFGKTEFAARFFPALFGVLGLFLTYGFARRLYGEKTGFWSAVILGTSFEYWVLSKTIITDLTLFVFSNAILVCFYLAYSEGKRKLYWLCYIFAALAVLDKGPIGLLLPGFIFLVFLILRRDLKTFLHMHFLRGMILFFILASAWYVGMWRIHGDIFLETFLGVHNILRATVSEHPQWDVWYYYTAIFFLGFFPWCFVLPMKLWQLFREHRRPTFDSAELFLFLWALLINVFYQCMATKYSTYTLPALLPTAILTAKYLRTQTKLKTILASLMVIVFIGLTYFVAIPVTNEKGYSGKELAAAMEANGLKASDFVGAFQEYSASTVYYSGHEIYQLVPRDAIAADEPHGMNWSAKNVQPFLAYEDIPQNRDAYLIVRDNKSYSLPLPPGYDPKEWKLLKKMPETHSAWSLYYRPAIHEP